MAVSLILSFLASAAVMLAAVRIQKRVWIKYMDASVYAQQADFTFQDSIPRPGAWEMTDADHFISEACDFLETYSSLVISVAGTIAAVFLFYRNKLKTPLQELSEASGRIAKTNWISGLFIPPGMSWAGCAGNLRGCGRSWKEMSGKCGT